MGRPALMILADAFVVEATLKLSRTSKNQEGSGLGDWGRD
jgi:hypothetical protein